MMNLWSMVVLLAIFFVAYSNGSNDNFKGVATLLDTRIINYQGVLWPRFVFPLILSHILAGEFVVIVYPISKVIRSKMEIISKIYAYVLEYQNNLSYIRTEGLLL
jgi:phosphate/sulfate permease